MTGITPIDRSVFSDLEYFAANMTNIPLEDNLVPEESLGTLRKFTNQPTTSSSKPSMSSDYNVVQIAQKLFPLSDASKKRSTVGKRKFEINQILTS